MNHQKVQRMTGLALFTAIIVVLQLIATFFPMKPFAITLTLIPIVVGAAIYGPSAGAYLGFVFGLVVTIACIFGWDAGGNILWNASPILTAIVCLAKGTLAGWAAGGVFRVVGKKNLTAGAFLSALVSPVVNTGIFLLALYFLFYDILLSWAAGTNIMTYMLTGLVGVNFLLELAVNLILSPVIVRLLRARGSMTSNE